MDKLSIKTSDKSIVTLKQNDKLLSFLIDKIGDIECNIHFDGFCFIVDVIIEQMLSNKVANILHKRLRDIFSEITPAKLANATIESIKSIGISQKKAEYIKNFSLFILENPNFLKDLEVLEDEEVIKQLTSIKGIGNWTAKMYLLFVLQRPDILPYEDGAFLQAYKWLYQTNELSSKDIKKNCIRWKPYSSYAARYLYRALDSGLCKIDINTFLSE